MEISGVGSAFSSTTTIPWWKQGRFLVFLVVGERGFIWVLHTCTVLLRLTDRQQIFWDCKFLVKLIFCIYQMLVHYTWSIECLGENVTVVRTCPVMVSWFIIIHSCFGLFEILYLLWSIVFKHPIWVVVVIMMQAFTSWYCLQPSSGTSNTLGAIASTSEGLAAIKDLENSCHAADLIFQCLRIVSQHFEEVWWGWHGGVLLLLPVHNSCELSTTAGRSSSSTVSPLHNKDINEHQQTPPGKTTAFLHPPGWGKRVFPHWNDWKTFQQALSLPRSRPRVHRGFYIGNQPARATWVLETLVSKQNWVLQFLSQKFNEARSWSRELGGSQPSHNIPHSHYCNHDAAHNNILHNTPPICTSTTLFQSYSSIHVDLQNNTKDQSLFAAAHQLQMSSLPLISCVSRQAPFHSVLSFCTFHKNVQQYLYHQYQKKLCSSSPISFPPSFLLLPALLPSPKIISLWEKDPFLLPSSSLQVLPSLPSSLSLSFSLLPSAENPKCTTTGLSKILLILLNPLLFCLALIDNPFY